MLVLLEDLVDGLYSRGMPEACHGNREEDLKGMVEIDGAGSLGLEDVKYHI